MKRILVIGVLAAVLGIATPFVWYQNALRPAGTTDAIFKVDEGQSSAAVAKKLEEQQLIKSATAFTLYLKLNSGAGNFKSGQHKVSAKQTVPEIAKALSQQPDVTQFTIREGITQEQIATLLDKQGVVEADQFKSLKAAEFAAKYTFLADAPKEATLEGFLFPETYTVPPPGTSTTDVATIMLNQFDEELTDELRAKIKQSGRSVYDTVIVASLVEEEVKTDEDRRKVAGIIYKRLQQGIRLDIDATVRYALNKPTAALTKSDLDSDDPYNTRKFKGLPPGPIASPGIRSIEAAINPEASEFLFYLSDKQGITRYGKTNDEHEANIAKYLR